jgi:ABC-type nitrate/sulfonate/bicarbonate transport system substrate-binding protein
MLSTRVTRIARVLAVSFLAIGSAAFSDTLDQSTIRILVPQSTSALPFFLMAKENPIAGVSIRVDTFLSHPQALAVMLRGEADMLFTGTSQGWENRLGGSPIVMIDTGVWGISSLVGSDMKIKGFSDLKGKRIALPFPGSPLDFQSRAALVREHVNPDRDLTISYGAFTQSLPRLLAGQLDGVALPEPQATAAVKEHGLVRLFTFFDAWAKVSGGDGRSPQVSLFATGAFTRTRKALIVELVNAWKKASMTVAGDPAVSAVLFAPALSTDSGVLQEAVRNTLYSVPSFTENKTLVLAYYREVLSYLSGGNRPLDDGFFFLP